MLIDLEAQAAVFIVLDQLTKVGIGGSIGGQALFELGIVSVDFSGAVVFVEIQFGDFSFLLGDLFHLTFLSWVHFPGSRVGKLGLKFDSEAVNDVLVVHGFSIGCKAEFNSLSIWVLSQCGKSQYGIEAVIWENNENIPMLYRRVGNHLLKIAEDMGVSTY